MKSAHVFKRLSHYIFRYRLRLLAIAVIGLFGVGFEVIKPLPIKLVIDNVLADHPIPPILNDILQQPAFLTNKFSLLIACFATLVVAAICSAAISLIVSNLTVSLAQRLVYDVSVDFYSKLQRLSLTFYLKNQVGDLLQRMSSDVYVVYFMVAQIALPVLTSVICLSAMFYIMVKINLTLAIIAFSVVPFLGIALGFFVKPMNTSTTLQYNKQGQLLAFVQQSLSFMRIIQAFSREAFMYRKLENHALEFSNSFKRATNISMTYVQLSYLITSLATALVVGLGAYQALNNQLSTGEIFIFLGYISALYGPVNSLTTAIGTAVTIGARGKRVFDILDSDEEVKEKYNAINLTAPKGAVVFNNVSFGYVKKDGTSYHALKNISFHVQPGQTVAIVGQTGAGKTSLISLLARFYDPWEGEIIVDGINVRELKLKSLRENMALVLQDPFLFPMSIADNIAFGNPDASREEIVAAAKAAQAHDFITNMHLGYDTVISESGASLSGGEKQRIAIARAFIKKAPILILDEPTSAVDAITESKIFSAIKNYSQGKTIFLISHRLSTIKHADQIITLQNGSVKESGTHDLLIQQNSTYAELYKQHHIS